MAITGPGFDLDMHRTAADLDQAAEDRDLVADETGRWKDMPSTEIVTARPRAWSEATEEAARSICAINQPPKTSP
jgi:hypothetical protein